MNTVPLEIDINEWEKFGDGFTADSFYHKTDQSLVLKLYADFMHPDEGLLELEKTNAVHALGIPVPRGLSFVRCENRYGVIFERVPGKKSFARDIFECPEKIEEDARLFADIARNLHSTKCDISLFPDIAKTRRKLAEDADYLSDSQRQVLFKTIDQLPQCDTCVHGDFHIGNVIKSDDDRVFYIDVPSFSFGSPDFDLGTMLMMAKYIPEEICKRLYHIDTKTYYDFWTRFVKYYFDGENIETVEHRLKPFVALQVIYFIDSHGNIDDDLLRIIQETIGE